MVGNGGLLPRPIDQSLVTLLMSERRISDNFIRRTKQETNVACIAVRLPPETVRRPLERRPRPPNPRQLLPHLARVFRRLLPITTGSSPTLLCTNIGPAPSSVKRRKSAVCFVSDPVQIRGERRGRSSILRSILFHSGANVVEWRQLSSVRNRSFSTRRRTNDRRRHRRT